MADGEARIQSDTRTRLLRAAEWLIVHEGVHAVTIRRIAAEANSNSALIGYHFGGVGGLLNELARLNSEPILADQKRGFQAIGPQADLDALLGAFLRPLWREAALNPAERALVVINEIVSRAEPQLRAEVWSWFAEAAQPYHDGFARLLPRLSPEVLRVRLRFLGAAALDMPPRRSLSAFAAFDTASDAEGEDARCRQFLAFARGALLA